VTVSSDTRFKSGDPRTTTGGRRKGSRDRIETKMLEAIARDFEAHGEEAIKICRRERPNEYLKLVASLLPREVEASIDGQVVHQHQIESIRRVIVDPKTITIEQPARLLTKAEPEPDLKDLY
jgi:hypothetical protein